MNLRGQSSSGLAPWSEQGSLPSLERPGHIAGAAVWVSFLIGGIIALLQGYLFAKLGARYPSAGG